MMRSLSAPADEGGTGLGVAVAAAVPAALAEAAVFCLPVYTMVTAGTGATIPVSIETLMNRSLPPGGLICVTSTS